MLEKFDVSPEITAIFEMHRIHNDVEVLRTLELYKFRTRQEILEVLQKTEDDLLFKSVDNISRLAKYSELEHRTGTLIDSVSEKEINVLCKYGQSLDRVLIELNTSAEIINIFYVTPLNFELLTGHIPDYDSDILIKRIILETLYRKGTDIHFTVHHVNKEPVYKILYRRNGVLCNLDLFQLNKALNKELIYKLISWNTNKDTIDLESSFGVTASATNILGDNGIELRVAANKVRDGYECVCRIQNTNTVTMRISELGFPKYVQDDLYTLAQKQGGITLITGPIRTGKNTTAFALANEMVKKPVKIKSFESPIEALMDFPQIDYMDNPEYLRNAIRIAKKQDLNIAFLNEIPNKEVAFAVKDLVNSSVYVITTLHINRLWHLPYKLYEFYGESYKDVISQINGIVNQKMFGVLCPNCCKTKITEDLADSRKVELLKKYGVKSVGIPQGCADCRDPETGEFGYVLGKNQPYVEHLIFNEEIKTNLMKCNEPYQMEYVLKNYLYNQEHELERSLAQAIKDRKLSVDALDSIL